MKNVVVLLIVLCMCSISMSAEIYFTGNVGGGFYAGGWEDPGSWNIFPDPAGRIPAAGDNTNIDRGWDGSACTINIPGAICTNLNVAHWYPNNSLTIVAGASVDVRSNVIVAGQTTGVGVINNYGIMTDTTDGAIMQFDIGAYGVGTLNMYSGSLSATYLNCPGPWGSQPSNSSHIQLDGGTIYTWDFRLLDFGTNTINGTMDITGGVLDISRAERERIQSYIDAGWLTGYGDPANVVIDDTSVAGHTIVTAIPEPLTMSLLGLGGLTLIRRRRA